MSTLKFRLALVGSCSAFGLLLGSAALAQNAPDTQGAGQAKDTGALEEVIVTSQKRSENLQKVPISVSTISSETLKVQGILKTDDLSVAVPGLQFGHEIDAATVFIRGIGPSSNGTGEESSVAIYFDDLYIPSGDASVFGLNAINSIEVLKGPQGTLFGRNATGGVVQVKTRDPDFAPSLDAHVGYGNYDTKTADLYASGAIIPDKFAANIALYENDESAGWGRDVVTGARAFTSNDFGARVKFLLTPFDGTKIKLSLAHLYNRSEEGAGFNQVPNATPVPGLVPPPTGAKYVGFYNTADNPNDTGVIKHDLVELRVDQDTPYAKIVNILGWQRFNGFVNFNQDGNGLLSSRLGQNGRTSSEELQLLNPDDAPYASWFKWIVGGFYEHDKSGYDPASLGGPALGGAVNQYIVDLRDLVTTESYAGFAQGTVEVLPDTHVTVGARYSRDERAFEGGTYLASGFPVAALRGQPSCLVGIFACPTAPGAPGSQKGWSLQSYRFSIDHQITEDILAYFAFNRGEKSGQFDTFGTAESGPIVSAPVNPEVLYSYEIGVKSELFDHTVRLNAAAFHYDISNLQLARIVSGATLLLNAAAAEVDGLEINAVIKPPVQNLTISGGLSTQYGKYTNFANAPDYFVPSQTFNATGAQTVRTPKFTLQIGADYVVPSTYGDFDLNLNLTHTSTFEWFADGSLPQPTTNIVNASVLWTAPSGNYDVRLWASNILNEKYYSYGSESSGLGVQFSPAPPATYGFTLGYHFF
jgi:iron complex outermembrane recepter protein